MVPESLQGFWKICMYSHCSQAFYIPSILRISRYAMLNTFPPGVGVLAASANSTTSSFFQIGRPLSIRATILVSFYAHSPLCPWVRLSHDHHRGDE